MKRKFITINKLSKIALFTLIGGILSSYFNFGIITVFFSVVLPILFITNSTIAIHGIFKKKYSNLIGSAFFLILYSFFFQFSFSTNINAKDNISLVTFNVRSFKQPVTGSPKENAFTEIKKFVDSINPDILLLQESDYKKGMNISGFSHTFLGLRENIKKSPMAIYSKYPIINSGFVDFSNTLNNAIYADIKIKQDTVRVYNTHLQSFVFAPHIIANKYDDFSYLSNLNNTYTRQIEQAKLVKNHALKSKHKVIICGDFNATPYSKPYRILKKGLNDSFVSKGNGFGATYTSLKYPLRLDYVLSDKRIVALFHNNFDLNLSDHEPIFVEFKI